MSPLSDDGSGTLPPGALRRLVVDLSQRLGALEAQVAELGDLLEKAETAYAALQAENQDLGDEIARPENLPPRRPFKPSGMDKITEQKVRKSGNSGRRGPKHDKNRVTREELMLSVIGTLGNVSICTEDDEPAVFSCKSTIFRSESADPLFLLTYLNTEYGRNCLLRRQRGAIQEGINIDDLNFIPVPRSEQGKKVVFLRS